MGNLITLSEYAASIGKTKKAVECMIYRRELTPILRNGRRYIRVHSEDTQTVLNGTECRCECGSGDTGVSVGEYDLIIDELREALRQADDGLLSHKRHIERLNACLNEQQELICDLLERTVQLENERRQDRQAVVTYREREEAGRTWEAQGARPNRLLGIFQGRRVAG